MAPIDWRFFSEKRFHTMQQVLAFPAVQVPIGKNYFGQIRVGDLNYNIQPGHIAKPGMGREADTLCFLGMAYAPHNPTDFQPPTMEFLSGKPIDYVPEADFIIPKERFQQMTYASFVQYISREFEDLASISEVHDAIQRQTDFWYQHDNMNHASAHLLPEIRVVPTRDKGIAH